MGRVDFPRARAGGLPGSRRPPSSSGARSTARGVTSGGAWADLGVLNLLNGRQHDALWTYDHFASAGALRGDYESTLTVLRELRASLSRVQPARAAAFAGAIEHLDAARRGLR